MNEYVETRQERREKTPWEALGDTKTWENLASIYQMTILKRLRKLLNRLSMK